MAKQLIPSDFNAQVTILQRVDTNNARGEPVAAWVAVAGLSGIWAKRMPLRARELVAAGQLHAPVDERYQVRYRAGITGAMRLQHGAVVYDIVGEPVDVDNAHITLEINCTAGARDGR